MSSIVRTLSWLALALLFGWICWTCWRGVESGLERLGAELETERELAAGAAMREGLAVSPSAGLGASEYLSGVAELLDDYELDFRALAGDEPDRRRARRAWNMARGALEERARAHGLKSWALVRLPLGPAWPPVDPGDAFVLDPPPGGAPANGRAYFVRSRAGRIAQVEWTLLPWTASREESLALVEWIIVGSEAWGERMAGLARRARLSPGSVALVPILPGLTGAGAPPDLRELARIDALDGTPLASLRAPRTAFRADMRDHRAGVFLRAALPALLACALVVLLALGAYALPLRELTRRVERATDEGRIEGTPPRGPKGVRRLALAVERAFASLQQEQIERAGAERRAAWEQVARRVAHEVKNPLTPIRVAVENVQRAARRGDVALAEALPAECAAILEEVRRLERLVNEFAEFARLPQPRLERLEILPLVREALEGQVGSHEAVQLRVSEPSGALPLVSGDRDLLVMAFSNLARNAVEAMGSSGGVLHLRADVDGDGRSVVLEIEDEGPGLPDELLENVFVPYVSGRSEGGRGLGLAITRRIIAEHRGRIEAQRGARGGALFRVRLPGTSSSSRIHA